MDRRGERNLVRAMDKRAGDALQVYEQQRTLAIGYVEGVTLSGAAVRLEGSGRYLSNVQALRNQEIVAGTYVVLARIGRGRWIIIGAMEQQGRRTVTTETDTVLAAPANLSGTDLTTGVARLEWDASVFDIRYWHLQIGTASTGAESDFDFVLTDNSQYFYDAADAAYFMRVRAVGSNWRTSSWTGWVAFQVTSTGGSITFDHGSQSGLADDDHPQYHLKNGFDSDIGDNVTMTFTDGSLEFEIAPTGASFTYWDSGVLYTSTGDTVSITDTEGEWYIYYVDDVLTASQTAWALDGTKVPVAILYWDAANNTGSILAYELHNWELDDSVHKYMHTTFGSRWASGLGVADAGSEQVNVGPGTIYDEDIPIVVTDDAGSGWWDQTLSPAELPIFYRSGAAGDWRKIAATTTPVHLDTNVLQYNEWTGAVWQLSNVQALRHAAYWIICTNNVDEPVISVPGQEDGATLSAAVDGNSLADMDFTGLPSAEHKVLARVIVQRKVASPYYEIEQIDDYRNLVDAPSGASAVVGDHGLLVGLSDDDHTQYVLADGTRDLAFTPVVLTDWDGDADPGDVDDALDQLAERVDDLELLPSVGDASDVTYTVGTASDWDAGDPGNVDDALDELAARMSVEEAESGGSGGGGATDPLFQIPGAIGAASEVDGVWVAPRAATIEYVYIYCRDPGSASSTIVDVQLNGVTIFTTQGNRPELAYDDADQVAKSGVPDVTALVENDVLSIDIDQAATGAEDLTVLVALEVTAGASGGAPTDATYVVTGSHSDLTAEVALPQMGYYDPDTPPASPGSFDDEFDDDSIAAAWTLDGGYDTTISLMSTSGAHASESEYHGMLAMQNCTASKTFNPSISQAWTLVTKIHLGYQPGTNERYASLKIIGQSSSHYYDVRVGRYNAASEVRTVYDNGVGGAQGVLVNYDLGSAVYLMIVHDGAETFRAFVSSNGIGWSLVEYSRALSNMDSFTTLELTVTDGTPQPLAAFEFIRYFTTQAQHKIGRDV